MSSAGLLSEELARGGFDPILRRVETRADFEGALAGETWDIVLADLTAPGLTAFEALELLKQRDLDVPFVVVAEALVEEAAVRAMRGGAQNCIAYQNLARLGPILERELREAAIRRERRIAQQALSESELRLRSLAESSPDAILIADASGTLLFVNRAAGELFGHPAASLIGRPIVTLLPDDPLRPGGRAGDVPIPWVGRHAEGEPLALELVRGELFRDGKRLTTVYARRLEEVERPDVLSLRLSEEVFRRAAMMAADLVHECDRTGGRIQWYGDIDRVLGSAPGEFPRTVEGWEKAIHPEDRGRVTSAALRHFQTGEPFFEEYRVQTRDGRVVHWHHAGTLLPPAGGRPARSIGTITDISGRRQIEEALQVSERRYRALFERNLAGVYRTTIEGRILDCNESFARIFGYTSREEVLRQAAWDFYVNPEDRQAAVAKLVEPSLSRDITLAWRDGRRLAPAAAEFLELARETFGGQSR